MSDEIEAVKIPDPWELGPWEVHTSPVGAVVHVSPVKGLMSMTRMSMGLDCGWHRKRKYVYPKNEKELAQAIAACQRYCDKLNAEDEAGKRLFAKSEPQEDQ